MFHPDIFLREDCKGQRSLFILTMRHINMLLAFFLLLGFPFYRTVVAQPSTVAPQSFWEISTLQRFRLSNGYTIAPVLYNSIASYEGYFCFYTIDGDSFVLSIMISGPAVSVIWSANPENPVSKSAILKFTEQGDLLLDNGDGAVVWSTATERKSVVGMSLNALGNLVLFNQSNSSIWHSFDHPTDTLVLGQPLCRGVNLSARISNTKWPSARAYLSAEWEGLHYSFQPSAYNKLFATSTASNCYAFVNGSFGMIFSLVSARSWQFMRLDSDGHLRLYEMHLFNLDIVLDVLAPAMSLCDYPMACGDYGVCNNGQCSCPSLRYFSFQNERLPSAGCIPTKSISCDNAHHHMLVPLNNVSYFSETTFLSLASTVPSENFCKQSCLTDCSCKVVLFLTYGSYVASGTGYCLLLSEQKLILFAEDSSNRFSAFLKIQDNRSEKISVVVGSTVASFSLILSILVGVAVWKRCKKDEERLFDGIPGIPKRFSFNALKVATGQFSLKLGSGGFGSVFKGKMGKETIAVKRLEGVEQGMEEFLAEVKTIGRIHHHNLVRLVGFCAEKSKRLLVYEYLSNGSLDKWIFHTGLVFTLSWKTRHNIILGIARGLSYLHEECEEKIAHLDIKPQNILVDDKFNAKLSDFGLSKMINRDQSKVMTRMRGTRGYLAPEWLGSTITEKADIYSFGIVVIEIICGRQNLDESQPEESIHLISLLQEKARAGQLFDLVDSSSTDMKLHMEEVLQMMQLAMWCLQVDSTRRPLMSTVAKVLEGAMSLEATPACTFVPDFTASNTAIPGSSSSYIPAASHLSGPR